MVMQSSVFGYERRVGRWSRLIADKFIDWLGLPGSMRWLDIGCGTGALTQAILQRCRPSRVTCVDLSESDLEYAQWLVTDRRADFLLADGESLPFRDASFDAVVSGLVLNHLQDKQQALAQMKRVRRSGGRVGGYVWDYAGQMQMFRLFWDAATALDPGAESWDQGKRFPICKPEPLAELFAGAGLEKVETCAIDVPTIFSDFDDYWVPMTTGEGTVPEYLLSLSEERRTALRDRLKRLLPTRSDGTIHLVARAWAVSG